VFGIKRLIPIDPRQTSVLELLLVCYFHILHIIVYCIMECELYYVRVDLVKLTISS